MLCIYHIADHDGKGSAAIVKYAHKECELLGYNYDQEIPYEEIDKHDKIVICDISFPMEYMFKLHAEKDVTWIDHHASAIAQYDAYLEKAGGLGIKGLREIGKAAIELTWNYFFLMFRCLKVCIYWRLTTFLTCVISGCARLNLRFNPKG